MGLGAEGCIEHIFLDADAMVIHPIRGAPENFRLPSGHGVFHIGTHVQADACHRAVRGSSPRFLAPRPFPIDFIPGIDPGENPAVRYFDLIERRDHYCSTRREIHDFRG